jgi:hypothetical protein
MYVAKQFFRQNKTLSLTVGESSQKTWASFDNFTNLPKVNDHPKDENSPNLITLLVMHNLLEGSQNTSTPTQLALINLSIMTWLSYFLFTFY